MGSISIWHWLIVLLVIVLVFGTKKLRNVGHDLGSAVKGFKEGIKEASGDTTNPPQSITSDKVIDGEIREKADQKTSV